VQEADQRLLSPDFVLKTTTDVVPGMQFGVDAKSTVNVLELHSDNGVMVDRAAGVTVGMATAAGVRVEVVSGAELTLSEAVATGPLTTGLVCHRRCLKLIIVSRHYSMSWRVNLEVSTHPIRGFVWQNFGYRCQWTRVCAALSLCVGPIVVERGCCRNWVFLPGLQLRPTLSSLSVYTVGTRVAFSE
jgi:hypothetical protein